MEVVMAVVGQCESVGRSDGGQDGTLRINETKENHWLFVHRHTLEMCQ